MEQKGQRGGRKLQKKRKYTQKYMNQHKILC